MWLILLLGFYTFGTISRLERRKLAVKYPQYNLPLMVLYFLFAVPMGYVAAFFIGFDFSNLDSSLLAYTVLGSAIWPISGYIGYKANVLTGAGLFTIIGSLTPVVVIIIALILLSESLSAFGVVGVVLILVANFLVVNRVRAGAHPDLIKGVLLSALTAVAVGLGVSFEKSVLNSMSLGTYIFIGWTSQALWALILAWVVQAPLREFFLRKPAHIHESIPFAASSALKSGSFLASLSIANASIVAPATNFIAVIVVVASYFLLDERDHMLQKVIAVLLGVTGLILLSLNS